MKYAAFVVVLALFFTLPATAMNEITSNEGSWPKAWPHILKLKTDGAELTLLNGKTLVPALGLVSNLTAFGICRFCR